MGRQSRLGIRRQPRKRQHRDFDACHQRRSAPPLATRSPSTTPLSFPPATSRAGPAQTTANSKRGGVAYNLNLNKKAFVFGSVDLESDQFQDLDLRFTPAGGGGYHAIATMPTQLDLRAGAAAESRILLHGAQSHLRRTSAGRRFRPTNSALRRTSSRSWISLRTSPIRARTA